MPFKDDYDFDLLVNESEKLIINELEKQLSYEEHRGICLCHECVLDMATYALNKVKPKYHSSFTGIIYAQQYYSGDYRDEIINIVKEAISKISANPSHEIAKK